MENRYPFREAMKNHLVPKLQHIVAVNINSVLIFHSHKMKKLNLNEPKSSADEISVEILGLTLPEAIKSYVKMFTFSMVNAIIDYWKFLMERSGHLQLDYLKLINCIVWTPRGDIHYKETGRKLLESGYSGFSDAYMKYKISCIHCLENEALVRAPANIDERIMLVSRKPEEFYFICAKMNNYGPIAKQIQQINFIYSKQRRTQNPFLWFVTKAEFRKYIFEKMSDEEKEESVVDWLNSDVLFHHLSHCNEIVIQNVLSRNGLAVRIVDGFAANPSYFDFLWPFVSYFSNFMQYEDFRKILCNLLNFATCPLYQSSLAHFCEQLWISVSVNFKDSFFEEKFFEDIFKFLVRTGNLRFIKRILGCTDAARRRRILFSPDVLYECAFLAIDGKKEIFNSLVEDVIPIVHEPQKFKEAIVKELLFKIETKTDIGKIFEWITNETEMSVCDTDMYERLWANLLNDTNLLLDVLNYLLRKENWRFIESILAHCNDALRKRMTFSVLCIRWIENRNWEMLNSFMEHVTNTWDIRKEAFSDEISKLSTAEEFENGEI